MHVKSYAKVNLTLEVLGVLGNGYHEIASVIQMIDFSDDIEIELAPELTVWCSRPDLNMEDNLAYIALSSLQEYIDKPVGVCVRIKKNMPIAAGLAGGTSNAITVLLAACKLLEIRLSDKDLHAIAEGIGADAPYFLSGGTALVTGWGEKIQTLADAYTESHIILLCSDMEVANKTLRMYGLLESSMFSDSSATNTLVSALGSGGAVTDSYLYNVFDAVALKLFPELQRSWQDFAMCAKATVHLSGSGPTLFALVPSQRSEAVIEKMQTLGYDPIIGSMLGGSRG